MKKQLAAFLLIFIIATATRLSAQDTLLLFHPTVDNVELIHKLMDQHILEAGDIHVMGVYCVKETYDYDQTRQFLADNPGLPFNLKQCRGNLTPGNIFMENGCTALFETLFDHSVGALFMGGPDIPPEMYNEQVHLLTVVTDPFRHFFEVSYLFHLLGGTQNTGWEPFMENNRDYLVSGICLGMQTLNVSTGGTLVQDIPTELYQRWTAEGVLALPSGQQHLNYLGKLNMGCEDPTSYHFHPILLRENSFLVTGAGFDGAVHPMVLSAHHQAVEQLGKGWRIAATSMDEKVIEAIEHETYPYVFGVQFHPEKPGLFDPSIIHPESCDRTISFNEAIRGTDSYSFHLAYWGYLGKVLGEIRNKEIKR